MKRVLVLFAFAAMMATTVFALPSIKAAAKSCCDNSGQCCAGGSGDCCK
ncbi:hypothetical protein [Terracidiphilus gabretensis]|nr:hypothetical protein [Terracidiphilus gabretensis]